MKNIHKISFLALIAMSVSSCKSDSAPNYQFFPNMYESVGYETYAESEAFNGANQLNGQTAQLPADGSIKRGYVPYEIPNTTEGYNLSKDSSVLKSPYEALTDKEKAAGKELYNVYCAVCHGSNGNGKGILVEREKFLGVPSYADREITDGSIFHVITYGLNSMGSHASQLSTKERWLIADYVLKLKSEL
jgi:hypothetical protein